MENGLRNIFLLKKDFFILSKSVDRWRDRVLVSENIFRRMRTYQKLDCSPAASTNSLRDGNESSNKSICISIIRQIHEECQILFCKCLKQTQTVDTLPPLICILSTSLTLLIGASPAMNFKEGASLIGPLDKSRRGQ